MATTVKNRVKSDFKDCEYGITALPKIEFLATDLRSIFLQLHLFSSSTSPKISPSFFRSRVSYIPQRPSLYPGTPLDFLNLVSGFKSNRSETLFPSANDLSVTNQDIEAGNEIVKESTKGKGWKLLDANPSDNALQIPTPTSQSSRSSTPPQNEENQPQFTFQSLGYPLPSSPHLPSPNLGPDPIFFSSAYWNLPTRVWRSDWSQISGGEAQRAGLAIGLGMKIRQKGEGVLLLDGELESRSQFFCDASLSSYHFA